MGQELKRGTTRIVANYTRLLITLSFGILVVPLAIRWLGDEAFGIISLLGANIGLAGIFRQIIQMSLVREMGQAFHANNDEAFRRSYATICIIAVICTLLSVVSFAIVYLLIPVFQIPEEFIGAARWFVIGQGGYTAAMILLAPMFNMYLVKERFIEYNLWYILVRAGNPLSVLILGYAIVIDDPARGLALHGITWAAIASAGLLTASSIMVYRDRRLFPTLRGSDKEARDQVLSTFSWNTGVQVAVNLHEQIPPLLLNLFGGTLANAAWGIGYRFVAYIRMCTTGIQFGSDAVSARMASGDNGDESRRQLQRLINIQTKLTAMTALPAAAIVFVYGWPIFDLWVGHSLREYGAVMPVAVYMSKILSLALASRAISDTWLLILYGAGYVRVYAPWIFFGGILAPVCSVILMLTLPDHLVVYAPPAMFTIVLFVIHLIGLPFISGRCLHIHPLSLLMALWRPILATLIAIGAAILVLFVFSDLNDLGFTGQITSVRGEQIDRSWMFASIMTFTITYTVFAFWFVMSGPERKRITGLFGRALKRGSRPPKDR